MNENISQSSGGNAVERRKTQNWRIKLAAKKKRRMLGIPPRYMTDPSERDRSSEVVRPRR
jgi:hypothetical protein